MFDQSEKIEYCDKTLWKLQQQIDGRILLLHKDDDVDD
jgi:hypothetical protein